MEREWYRYKAIGPHPCILSVNTCEWSGVGLAGNAVDLIRLNDFECQQDKKLQIVLSTIVVDFRVPNCRAVTYTYTPKMFCSYKYGIYVER